MGERGDTETYLSELRETAHILGSSLEESEIIQALLAQVISALGAHGALVRLLSPDGDELLPAGFWGLSEAYLQKGPVRVAESKVDQRVLAGETVVIADVTREPGFQYPEAAAREGLRGMVTLPLSVRSRIIGVVRVYVDDVAMLQPADMLLLNTLTDLGALALEKVRLHQSLYRIAEALNSSLDLEPMLRRVLEATVKEMWLKAGSIRLLDSKQQILRLVAAHGLSQAYLAKGEVHVARSPVDQRVLQGEAVVLYDVEHEPGFEYPDVARQEGIRSVLVVPLRMKDHTLGVMRVYSAQPRRFGPVAVSFLRSVADLVALAIENAELYAALQARYEDLKVDLAEWYKFLALG
ncbi:MAG: GAF domain-containing protein [Acidobacteria bacterium]|nr:GAF domain-containing protein [Acidobacteriota bacterium]